MAAAGFSDLLALEGVWLGGRKSGVGPPGAGFSDLLALQGVWLGGRKPRIKLDGSGGARRFRAFLDEKTRAKWRAEFDRRIALIMLAAASEDD